MTKATIRPYYKYKREAYNKIQEVARLFLKENDFFIRTGLPQDIEITFRNDTSVGVKGNIDFYIRGEMVLSIFGTQVTGKRGYDTRGFLTSKEHEILTDNLRLLFRHSPSQTVPLFIGEVIKEWEITGEYCFFMGAQWVSIYQQRLGVSSQHSKKFKEVRGEYYRKKTNSI